MLRYVRCADCLSGSPAVRREIARTMLFKQERIDYPDYCNDRRIKAKWKACRLLFTGDKPFRLLEQCSL